MSSKPNESSTALVVVLVVCGLGLVLLVIQSAFQWDLFGRGDRFRNEGDRTPGAPPYPIVPQTRPDDGTLSGHGGLDSGGDAISALINSFVRAFLAAPDAVPRQATLRFKSDAAYQRFLAEARARGIDIRGFLDGLRAVSIGFASPDALRDALAGFGDDVERLAPNYQVSVPHIPTPTEARTEAGDPVGFGADLLGALGIEGDNSAYGKGITVAVLDSGIAEHPAFANTNLTSLVLSGAGAAAGDDDLGHGTAVTSIIAGEIAEARGVAPRSDLLSYRITNADGLSDSFLLAEGIMAATDAGAQIINISLGSESDSSIVADAVTYAAKKGVLIVAPSGNETGADATFPARYSGVVSVGGNDAGGYQLSFSNSSPTLDLSAPGYQVNAAYPGDRIVAFTGTSASAPAVTGAIAAVMSERNLSGTDALALLRLTADEAGAPGIDPAHGYGIINVGRALESGRATVTDAAAVRPFYDPASNQIHFSVENRGTTPLVNVPLNISVDGRNVSTYFANIPPNVASFYSFQLTPNAFSSGAPLAVESRVTSGAQTDARPANNTARAQIPAP
ncbi:hypothetical protein BH23VER1_BH23VER1_33330 [soil metagenome]